MSVCTVITKEGKVITELNYLNKIIAAEEKRLEEAESRHFMLQGEIEREKMRIHDLRPLIKKLHALKEEILSEVQS